MGKGLFITFEGGDGAGKSTQIELLRQALDERGFEVLYLREPGGTSISEQIREVILDSKNAEMADVTEALLYAAARAQLVDQIIKPALAEGKVIICDRFVDSSIAYQAYGRGLGDMVWDINKYAVDDCMPDLTILLKIEYEEGSSRISGRELDRIEMASMDFHKRVLEGYKLIEKDNPDRVLGINARDTIESISEKIISSVLEKLV